MSENPALDHLGAVLTLLADLDPGDRCDALDEAIAFYNAARPDRQVVPSGVGATRLVHHIPGMDG